MIFLEKYQVIISILGVLLPSVFLLAQIIREKKKDRLMIKPLFGICEKVTPEPIADLMNPTIEELYHLQDKEIHYKISDFMSSSNTHTLKLNNIGLASSKKIRIKKIFVSSGKPLGEDISTKNRIVHCRKNDFFYIKLYGIPAESLFIEVEYKDLLNTKYSQIFEIEKKEKAAFLIIKELC